MSNRRADRKRWEDLTEPEIIEALRTCERALELVCRELRVERPLYFLLMLNDPKEGSYISNVEGADLVAGLAECLGRLQRGEDWDRG